MRWLRRTVIVLLVVVLAAGAYVGYSAVQSRRSVNLPEVGGGGPVGRRQLEWTDPARDRTLSVWVWYPASARSGAPAAYAPGGWGALHLPGPIGLGETDFARIRTRARVDARPRPGRHPLVVLAPGLGFAAVQYQALAETLAAHGYVVAGFTPTGSANVTVLRGRVVKQSRSGGLPDGSLYTPAARAAVDRLLRTWVGDAHFVARRARAALGGVRLTAGVVYAGHSFGGAAALEACHQDPACRGAANLDGLDAGAVTTSGLGVPTLLLGHQNSCVTGTCRPGGADDRRDRTTARRLVAAGTGPAWSVRLAGTEHFDLTDYAAYRLAYPLRRLLALGPRAGADALRTTERCLLDLGAESHGARPRWGCLRGALPGTTTRRWR